MATVKEVKLMDGEDQVTPYTLIDSVWYPNGTQFKENVYTKDQVYTKEQTYSKEEANSRFPRVTRYPLPDSVSSLTVHIEDMALGDIAIVSGDFTMEAKGYLGVRDDGAGGNARTYLIYEKNSNFPDAPIDTFSMKTVHTDVILSIYKNYSSAYHTSLYLFVLRVA